MADDLSDFRDDIQQALQEAAQDEAVGRRAAERLLGFLLRGNGPAGEGEGLDAATDDFDLADA